MAFSDKVTWFFYGIHRSVRNFFYSLNLNLSRIFLIAALFWFAYGCAHAKAVASPAKFDFKGVQVAQVIQLIYGEVLTTPYVIQPEVLGDGRMVSFRFSNDKGDIKAFLQSFLAGLGYSITEKHGVDIIEKRSAMESPSDAEIFIYRPQFREVNYLSRLLEPLFQGSFAVNRSIAISSPNKGFNSSPEGSAAALLDQDSDVLVFTGTDREIAKLKKFLPQVDFAIGEVSVRGVVYEVSTTDKEGSGFGLLANLLQSKLSVGVSIPTAVNSFIRFKNTSIDAVYSALNQDARFKVMSSPSLRVRSGAKGSFSVGQDVPVLGTVTYPTAGQAVQSVDYRQSGVIFNIEPNVKEGIINLDIDQQLSNFVQTTTGVNNSPTLTKRALKTSIGVQDGDLIVLGGLTEDKDSQTRDGLALLPKFMRTQGRDISRSEILLVLEVQRL